jgi:methionyl-tRNA formyltransferase
MRLVIATQNDRFFISNTLKIMIDRYRPYLAFAVLSTPSEIARKREAIAYYCRFWGFGQSIAFSAKYPIHLIGGLLGSKRFQSPARILRSVGVPVVIDVDVNSEEFIKRIKEEEIDYVLSIAHPKILTPRFLEAPKQMCINIHAGLLPKYRGFNPSFWVLFNRERMTGITIHKMVSALDAGPIIIQKAIDIQENETWYSLQSRISVLAGNMLVDLVSQLEEGRLAMKPQEGIGSQYRKPKIDDGIEFRKRGGRFV